MKSCSFLTLFPALCRCICLSISAFLQSSKPYLPTLWLQGMQNENNRQQQQQQEQQKTLRRTHFYNSKTEVSPCRAASSCLFIRVFGSCIVLLAMQERERKQGGKGGVLWHAVACSLSCMPRERARVNFLSFLLARHLCQGRKVSLCCLFCYRLFCCCC